MFRHDKVMTKIAYLLDWKRSTYNVNDSNFVCLTLSVHLLRKSVLTNTILSLKGWRGSWELAGTVYGHVTLIGTGVTIGNVRPLGQVPRRQETDGIKTIFVTFVTSPIHPSVIIVIIGFYLFYCFIFSRLIRFSSPLARVFSGEDGRRRKRTG